VVIKIMVNGTIQHELILTLTQPKILQIERCDAHLGAQPPLEPRIRAKPSLFKG
jgi:hypothetical protein